MPMKTKTLIASVVIVIIILAGAAGYLWWTTDEMKTGGYQAIFLTNGQVYFGRLTSKSDDYLVLTDIYYLQANKSLQSGNDAEKQDLALVKLGNELHGPTDRMEINKDNVLFIEDLSETSKVAEAIKNYKAK